MKLYTSFLIITAFIPLFLNAQENGTINKDKQTMFMLNSAENMLVSDSKLNIGGYGEAHYNQPLSKDTKDLGTLDLHRIVMFFGYNFSNKTSFVSEIEFEYAKEAWIEQAFIQHKLSKYINLRAGLMLVPMGIINEYHEPVTFNGVERPVIDNRIALSTWRELGAGIAGNIQPAHLRYQLYVMNGLSGYDGTKAIFNGNGLREGRQKGSKAYIHSPSFTGKFEFYGVKSLNIGLSGYVGNSQSKLFNKLNNDSANLIATADSSVTGIAMIGLDGRYKWKALELRGQFYYTSLSNTAEYNKFTAANGKNNDLGSSMSGYYIEAGYNVLHTAKTTYALIPFVRYEFWNTHNSVDEFTAVNPAYENTMITTGLTCKVHSNVAFKADMQFTKSAAANKYSKVFNAGIGYMF